MMTALLEIWFFFSFCFWSHYDPAEAERLPCTLFNLSFETTPCCGWSKMIWEKGCGPKAGMIVFWRQPCGVVKLCLGKSAHSAVATAPRVPGFVCLIPSHLCDTARLWLLHALCTKMIRVPFSLLQMKIYWNRRLCWRKSVSSVKTKTEGHQFQSHRLVGASSMSALGCLQSVALGHNLWQGLPMGIAAGTVPPVF